MFPALVIEMAGSPGTRLDRPLNVSQAIDHLHTELDANTESTVKIDNRQGDDLSYPVEYYPSEYSVVVVYVVLVRII